MSQFFTQLSTDDSAAKDGVFLHGVHAAIFSIHLGWWFRGGRKINLSKPIFFKLNSVPPCGTWMQLYQILAIPLLTFTHVIAILRWQAVRSPQKGAEKKSQRSTWTQPHLFQCDLLLLWNGPQILAIRWYLRSADTSGEKSQHVALVLQVNTMQSTQYYTLPVIYLGRLFKR